MNIFKASPEEFKKLDEEFKKTYIGRIMNISRIIFGIIFITGIILLMCEAQEDAINVTKLMIYINLLPSMFISFSIYFLGLINYANSKK